MTLDARMVITLSENGHVVIHGGKKVINENLQPRESFSVTAGDYTITVRRKDSPKRKIIKLR
jgi:bifunctional ADP-heptose synthase (sugar kinase/adenylyltransferase)